VLLRAARELSTVTAAFGTTAPFGSLIVISMLPVVSCAEAAPKANRKQNKSENDRLENFIFVPLIIYKLCAGRRYPGPTSMDSAAGKLIFGRRGGD
jgi:hypothetical protein